MLRCVVDFGFANQPFKQRALLFLTCYRQIFGVPLHADYRIVGRLDGFAQSVGAVCRSAQRGRNIFHRLVVERIDFQCVSLCNFGQFGVGGDCHLVRRFGAWRAALVVAEQRGGVLRVDVLIERAAHLHIQNLHAAADAQNRRLVAARIVDKAQVVSVARGIDGAAFGNYLFAEIVRVDVGTATQHKSIELAHGGGQRRFVVGYGNEQRRASSQHHRLHIGIGNARCAIFVIC